MRRTAFGVDGLTKNTPSRMPHSTFIRFSTAATTSMSSSRAPSMSISPPVIAPTTAQLPASM